MFAPIFVHFLRTAVGNTNLEISSCVFNNGIDILLNRHIHRPKDSSSRAFMTHSLFQLNV